MIEWTIDICDVLEYLHNHQPDPIVFRDIKPSNVMVDSLGKVRLIDFGIAKTFVAADQRKHTIIGTEGYSSPEQYKGKISPLSDQYSLGATLHHILTRKDPRLEHPFTFNDRPILEHNKEVPEWFVSVINKALAFDPADRFDSCAQMAEMIRVGLRGNQQPAGPGIVPGSTVAMTTGLANDIEPKWVFATEDEIRTTPAVYNDTVFVGSYDTNMWALKLADGELVWKFATEGGIASSPAVDGRSGLVLFGSEDHTFHALNYRTGRVMWSYKTKDRVRSSPVSAMDYVFFGSDDGFFYALMSSNGEERWKYDGGAEIRTRPCLSDDMIIFGNDLGEVHAITIAGERKWVYRGKRGVESSPVVDPEEGMCYVGLMDGSMYALDATSGYNSWKFRTGGAIISTPALYQTMLIFGSVDGVLYALDAYSSREKWRFPTDQPIISSPIIHNDRLYFGGTDGYLYCLEAKTGKEVWKFKAGGAILSTPFITEENTILFGSIDHKLYALPLID